MMALDKKATIADLVHACHAHPTLSEAIMEAGQQALGYPIHG
jgi:dihydrolipoamide dehydrogenase